MYKKVTISCAMLSYSLFTQAGSEQHRAPQFTTEKIASFAKSVEHYAAEQGARAFIIGRLGQPKSELPQGFQFTHTAIAIYSQIELEDGKKVNGYAIHNLYQQDDNANVSQLVTDYPVDFFWGVHALKAGIVIPTPALQQKLIRAIINGQNKTVHNPNYSLIANPFNNQYQNCTEHTLNVINAAIYQTDNMAKLKVNTTAYFKAQPVAVSRFKLALGNWFADGLSTDDHPKKVATASFTSIANYLKEYDLLDSAVIFEQKKTVPLLPSS
ncbi:hypothetical protein BGP78_03540 [Pseudoalteromonas sp. MSK9-3]|uniref:DUF2145 domain-containing protein n=1 Tax=Pseudoalteromonas sp. MSK9-3 TaxID=1897633 RepID=UPI000E6C128C|nr:DUF2145 domain-containing protein [Pseudoalteromonas sp. MSK9-3]RJE73345.1 hypothetical protein BGP78_03540 [Pseudoalteromonas sp. MSK9-3]